MNGARLLAFGGIFAGLAVLFQTAPVFLTELFLPITILSTLPVYFASRMKPTAGFCVFISAAWIIFLVSPHEGFFFICTNGITGLSLGTCRYHSVNKAVTAVISSLILASALCLVNYAAGIAIFGRELPWSLFIQLIFIFLFSVLYTTILMNSANFIYHRLEKFISHK